jgi:hypothetical protein
MSYPPSVYKTWIAGETLTAADLNNSFSVIPNNALLDSLNDWSTNTAQMQLTTDPYPSSVESLATDASGELLRLRYLIAQITGKTYWYQDPDIALSSVNTAFTFGASVTTAKLNFITTRANVGGVVSLSVENTDTANAASHSELLVQIDSSSSGGDARLHFNAFSPAVDYFMGIDNSDSDKFVFSSSASGLGTNNVFTISSTTFTFATAPVFPAGSLGAPGFSHTGSATSGTWWDGTRFNIGTGSSSQSYISIRSGTEGITVFVNGAEAYDLSSDFFPVPDNTHKCGKSGQRFTELWATNGTVQTSMSDTKTEIEALAKEDIKIPLPATFKRPGQVHDKEQLGFLADNLPEECFAVRDDGERSTTDIYVSSVIGMLCGAARNDYQRLNDYEARIIALEQKVGA